MNSSLYLCVLCLSIAFATCDGLGYIHEIDDALSVFKIYEHSYYNPMTGEPLNGTIDASGRFPFHVQRIVFRGLPCACVSNSCGCCAGLNISSIKLDRRYCVNMTFDPSKFLFNVKVMINDNEAFHSNISINNPPPLCVPLPYLPILEFCLRFRDIKIIDRNLHMCLDFEARIVHSPLLVLHFNCIRVGASGIGWSKPGPDPTAVGLNSTLAALSSSATSQEPSQEVYDEVYFESDSNEIPTDPTTTLSSEEENKIGEHRGDAPSLG